MLLLQSVMTGFNVALLVALMLIRVSLLVAGIWVTVLEAMLATLLVARVATGKPARAVLSLG